MICSSVRRSFALSVFIAVLSLGVFSQASASTAFVQGAGDRTYGSSVSTVAFSSNVSSDNIIAFGVIWGSAAVGLEKVTASCVSGDFVLLDNPTTYASVSRAAQGYAVIQNSGSCTISAKFTGPTNSTIVVHEISGVDTDSPVDGHAMNHQDVPWTATDAVTSGTITTTEDGDYIFGVGFDAGGNGTEFVAGTGYAARIAYGSVSGIQTEDRIQTVAGDIAATFTVTPGWAHPTTGVIAFKPAGAAIPDTTPPQVDMTAPNVSVTVKWTTDEPATSQVEYGLSNAYGQFTSLDTNLVTSHNVTIAGLLPNTSYEYHVRSKDSKGNETIGPNYSFIASIDEISAPVEDTTAPSTPAGLSGSAISVSQIDLTWAASTDDVGVSGYKVFRDSAQIATTTAANFSDTGLATSTNYSYSVKAFDAAGNVSASSDTVSVSTLGVPVADYGFMDFEAGTDGVVATPELLAASTHNFPGTWVIVDDGTKLTFSTSSAMDLAAPVTAGGVTYSATGTTGLKTSWAGLNHAELQLDGRYPNLSMGLDFKTSGGVDTGTHDLMNLQDAWRGIYAVVQMTDGFEGPQIHFHGNATTVEHPGVGDPIHILPDHHYWITVKFAPIGGRGQLNVYDAENDYALVGVSYIDTIQINPYDDYAANRIWIGAAKYGGPQYEGYSTSYDNIKISTEGEFPLMP